ncbi:Uncharacterised protein [Candidatus Burarchaeum australiense]|nr:Uncharacterised protein [Candidatus Burarchaeum australiense]
MAGRSLKTTLRKPMRRKTKEEARNSQMRHLTNLPIHRRVFIPGPPSVSSSLPVEDRFINNKDSLPPDSSKEVPIEIAISKTYEVVDVKGKLFVLTLVAMMFLSSIAAAWDPVMNQSVIFGSNPTKVLLNSSSNSSIVFNVTAINQSNLISLFVNTTSCKLYVSLPGTDYMVGPVNTTNSSGLALTANQIGFSFIIGNATVGALAERGRENAYNVTVNCTFTNGTFTWNSTNSTNLTIDVTAPTVALRYPADKTWNSSWGPVTFSWTHVDTGTNVSRCNLYLASQNSSQSTPSSAGVGNVSILWALNTTNATNVSTGTSNLMYYQGGTLALPYVTADANVSWNVQCFDFAGNGAFATSNRSVVIDNSSPVYVKLVSPTNNTAVVCGHSIGFGFSVYDDWGLASCSVALNYSGIAAGDMDADHSPGGIGFKTNATATYSTNTVGPNGNWLETTFYNVSAGITNYISFAIPNVNFSSVNWTVRCTDHAGHNTTNTTWFLVTLTNDTGANRGTGGAGSNPAPSVDVSTGCVGESTTISVSGLYNPVNINVMKVDVAPSQSVYTTVLNYDGSVNFVASAKGSYSAYLSGTGLTPMSVPFSVTCDSSPVTTPTPTTPPETTTPPAQPPAQPEQPPVQPPAQPPAVTQADAQSAYNAANAAIVAAADANKDVSAAQSKLAEALSALNAGNYENAVTLSNAAASLAESASALAPTTPTTPAPTTPTTPAPTTPTPAPSGTNWLLWIVVIVVIVAAAYYLMTKRKKY